MNRVSNFKQFYVICGASSGFGRAVADKLLTNHKNVLGIARNEEELKKIKATYPESFQYIQGDLSQEETIDSIVSLTADQYINGIFINSGGPPAKKIEETEMNDWDASYRSLLRWKVNLVKQLLPKFKAQQYGRILFLESSSVKQPIENLVLSTSLRSAVVGFAKTLSEEIAQHGITVNVLAPGYHDTNALNRLAAKKRIDNNISEEEVMDQFRKKTKVGKLGNPVYLASLAQWLLSEEAEFITGQTISVDGGIIKGAFG